MILGTPPARLLFALGLPLVLSACADEREAAPLFRLLPPERTGVDFANTITVTESHTFYQDFFLYNGAGVAVGDLDGDDLPEIFFSGNMVSSRLYRNLGDFRFEDITESAGVATDRWATGASTADIDADGDLDLYVSVSGPEWSTGEQRANLLFLNDGNARFREAAAAFGVADTGFTSHAAFLDYDRDGDLDLYLLGNSPGEFGRGETGRQGFGSPASNPAGFDRLYRNDGDGGFRDVSVQAGILQRLGYGLGVAVEDVNGDGWPDVYVSNDIMPQDVLYINNRDGTFTDRAAEWLGHTSFAGMGVDIADFDNNGWPDILQVDMMPADLAGRKRVSGSSGYADLAGMTRRGSHPQYNANSLQLNHGVDQSGRSIFSEVARMAGVAYTEWSWSALFGDYDNDGRKDIFITNGYPKAVIDFDYQSEAQRARALPDEREAARRARELLERLGGYRVANYVFRNEGGLTFSDRTRAWGLDQPGFSYGAAHADLNNDGALDLVVSNIDAPAFVYAGVAAPAGSGRFLQVRLAGEPPNTRGVGARLVLTAGGRRQTFYQSPYRGYMSTLDDRLHIGLGGADRADTLAITWPDGRRQVLTDVPANRRLTLRQREATARREPSARPAPRTPFLAAHDRLRHEHRENEYRVDYSVQPLLPHQLSRQGPPIAAADVNADGLDDVFIGGVAGSPGGLFLQQQDGSFVEAADGQPWADDAAHDDWGALFFDANGDGRPDLYVASGGYHTPAGSRLLQDRLYVNLGGGRFAKDAAALPEMLNSTAAVAAGDFTGDGRPDLFVGGRLTPRDYPTPTRSWLLRNDGGRFTDVTGDVAPELLDPGGMVTDAVWLDFDADGRLDLVTAGTWLPIRFHANRGGRLRDVTRAAGLPPLRGWWYALASGDLDGDGDPDLIAGNLGLNHSYTTSAESPFGLYAADFDGNRTTDLVFTQQLDGRDFPFYGLAVLGREINGVASRFPTFESFAEAPVRDVFGRRALRQAQRYEADTFASVWLRNDGGGSFEALELPPLAQISPIREILVHDVDGDGAPDLLVAGNAYETEPNSPRADAGKGLWLKGDGTGRFVPVSPAASGFVAPHDVRGLVLVQTAGGHAVLVANNDGQVQVFTLSRP